MKVVIAHESKEKNSGSYHVLNDAETASLCATVSEKSEFAADIVEVLSQESAKQHGFDLCGRCADIAD
ncbi:hypothetical protein [Halorussus aquaticus]|uniref:Uncharacterized protein n=1 Tax=Halorussus aquaticus TaxID=2953748 RepID=A0ABD5Q0V7_9EURY|nr:hypothetical protein [Halorussus aquaticus]